MEKTNQKRVPIKCIPGKVYRNKNGLDYECISGFDSLGVANMRCVESGWDFIAEGVCAYEDGTIDWDRSHGGRYT